MPSTILIKGHTFSGPATGLVPSDGTLIVDPDTNELKVGDGSTPGGVALAGGGGGGGATTFLALTDTPAEFTGLGSRFVKVNAGATALEFVADPGYLTSVPAQSFASLTGKPTTLAGYGITDAFDGAYGSLTGAPTMYANSDVDAHLNQSNPTSGYVLSWNGSDYAWVAQSGGGGGGGLNNVVEDTTPELGGDLDTNGKNILLLNNRIKYNSAGGSMLDFTVTQYSVGNNTVLSSVGSINFFLDSASADSSGDTAFRIFDTTDPDGTVTEANNIFKIADTGDVSIKGKLQFPDGGASSNYAAFGNADDLKIFHNGNHSIVRETGVGNLYLQSDNNVILSKDSDTEIMVKGIADGAVELYHDNVKKFETTTNGVSIVDQALVEGATPYLTLKRTNNANIPLIRFQGSGGFNGATIGMDGTGGTVNDLIISAYGNVERIRTGVTGSQITGDLAVLGNITATSSTIGSIQLIDNNIKSSDSTQLSIQTPTSFTNDGAPGVTIDGNITFEATGAITGYTVDIYGIGNGQVKIGNTGSSINPVKIGNANTAVSVEGAMTVSSSIKMAVQAGDPTNVPNYAHVYAKDDASSAEVFVQDEAGNVTKLSPHNQLGNWEYYSRNVKTGKVVRIDMEEMIKDIEQLTGKKYIKGE